MTDYYPRHYRSIGKEVLLDGEHIADAKTPEYANLIAESLNQRPVNLTPQAVTHDAGDGSQLDWSHVPTPFDDLANCTVVEIPS